MTLQFSLACLTLTPRMQAKNLIVTHFSQRFPKLIHLPAKMIGEPSLAELEGALAHFSTNTTTNTPTSFLQTMQIVSAQDYFSIKVGDLWKGKYYWEPTRCLVSGDDDGSMMGSGSEEDRA